MGLPWMLLLDTGGKRNTPGRPHHVGDAGDNTLQSRLHGTCQHFNKMADTLQETEGITVVGHLVKVLDDIVHQTAST